LASRKSFWRFGPGFCFAAGLKFLGDDLFQFFDGPVRYRLPTHNSTPIAIAASHFDANQRKFSARLCDAGRKQRP
jgi:hypothetical protein